MPGGFDDRTAFPVLEAVVSRYAEVRTFRVAEVLDIDTPDYADEFNPVQLFHIASG